MLALALLLSLVGAFVLILLAPMAWFENLSAPKQALLTTVLAGLLIGIARRPWAICKYVSAIIIGLICSSIISFSQKRSGFFWLTSTPIVVIAVIILGYRNANLSRSEFVEDQIARFVSSAELDMSAQEYRDAKWATSSANHRETEILLFSPGLPEIIDILEAIFPPQNSSNVLSLDESISLLEDFPANDNSASGLLRRTLLARLLLKAHQGRSDVSDFSYLDRARAQLSSLQQAYYTTDVESYSRSLTRSLVSCYHNLRGVSLLLIAEDQSHLNSFIASDASLHGETGEFEDGSDLYESAINSFDSAISRGGLEEIDLTRAINNYLYASSQRLMLRIHEGPGPINLMQIENPFSDAFISRLEALIRLVRTTSPRTEFRLTIAQVCSIMAHFYALEETQDLNELKNACSLLLEFSNPDDFHRGIPSQSRHDPMLCLFRYKTRPTNPEANDFVQSSIDKLANFGIPSCRECGS